jgi:hypothetical protein
LLPYLPSELAQGLGRVRRPMRLPGLMPAQGLMRAQGLIRAQGLMRAQGLTLRPAQEAPPQRGRSAQRPTRTLQARS